MSAQIQVDRHTLTYRDGPHRLELYVEWCSAKTAESGSDFEVTADNIETWTEPVGERIDPARRGSLLDEIAGYYSKGPTADIIGKNGELLRGVSKYRFYLHIYPTPSHYHEIGRFLAIPMLPMPKGARSGFVLDFSGITEWTEPKLPLEREHLEAIVARVRRDAPQVSCKLDGPAPTAEPSREAEGPKRRGFFGRWF